MSDKNNDNNSDPFDNPWFIHGLSENNAQF